MNDSNPVLRIRESAGFRLAVLFGTFFVMLLLCAILGGIIGKLPGDERTHMLISSVFQCLMGFCIPAVVLARFSSKKPKIWLHVSKLPSPKAIIGVIIIYLISMPAMEWLIEWNSNIHFPEFLSSLETQFRQWEQAGEESTKIILETNGWLSVLTGVLVVGFLTGFSEELFFRGGLQGIFISSNIGKGTAIWLAAFIFSTMHFQFFGFMPRLLMGAFFGYLLVWTGSLWVPVFAHVLNNSIVVVSAAATGEISGGLINQQVSLSSPVNMIVVSASVILTAMFLIFFKDSVFKTKNKSSWQKRQLPPVSES